MVQVYTFSRAAMKVNHYEDMSNWSIADFRNLRSTGDKELALQSIFPVILENVLALGISSLHYERRKCDAVQECGICLTSNPLEFLIPLPHSEDSFHFEGKCFECCRNREVSKLVRFLEVDGRFWLFDQHGDHISLISAASSAYGCMVMREHMLALKGAPTPARLDVEREPQRLSEEDSFYYASLAAFARA